jgi:hypothetical protein
VIDAKPARAPGLPEPAKSPSWVVLAVCGPTIDDPSAVPTVGFAGVFTGARAATFAGPDRRGTGGLVLVGHKWVVVLVALVVVGGTAMVVAGVRTVLVVDVGAAGWASCGRGAVGWVALESATCVCGVESTQSMATAVAVTRGAATTLVAGWRITPRLS